MTKAGRPASAAPADKTAPANEHALVAVSQAADQLAVATLEQQAKAQELADLFQYPGALNADAVEYYCREGLRRSVEGTLQLGAALCILKEITAHGEFGTRCEALGLAKNVRTRLMDAARRFAKSTKKGLLLGAGNQAKLLEMLAVDDDTIETAEQMGLFDKFDGMTASELRAALREAKADKEADDSLLAKKNARIDSLERKLKHFDRASPDVQLVELQTAATSVANEATGLVAGTLRQAVIALQNHGDERGAHNHFLAGLLAQVQAALSGLREEFSLPDISAAESDLQAGARQAIRAARQAGGNR